MRLGMTAEERQLAQEDDRSTVLNELTSRSFAKRLVVLASGKESDFYIDCKKALIPEVLICIGALFVDEIHRRYQWDIDGVGGLTMGADPLAVATASCAWYRRGKNWVPFYIRKEPKKHGTEAWLEGPKLEEGARVVIVEDVITTGASTIKAIQRARVHRLNPVMVCALVDRCEENGRKNIEDEGIPVFSLFSRRDFPA